jgi:hypothetical protein
MKSNKSVNGIALSLLLLGSGCREKRRAEFIPIVSREAFSQKTGENIWALKEQTITSKTVQALLLIQRDLDAHYRTQVELEFKGLRQGKASDSSVIIVGVKGDEGGTLYSDVAWAYMLNTEGVLGQKTSVGGE